MENKSSADESKPQAASDIELVDVSQFLVAVTEVILNSNIARWQKPGHNNDIRRDVARAFVERRLLDQLDARISAGAIVARNCADGNAIEGPIDFGFVCDINWCVSTENADQFSRDFSGWPSEIDSDVDDASRVTEERRQRMADQETDKRAAGRRTIKEAAAELARGTGIQPDRWKRTIITAVHNGELPLRNPQDYSDNLPYSVPKQLYSFVEQVDAPGLNRWLDLHPDWGVKFRFANQVIGTTANPEADDRSSPSKPPTDDDKTPHYPGGTTWVDAHDERLRETLTPDANSLTKSRRDVLDPAIDEAINLANTHDTAAVWLQLREIAISGTPPFTGSVQAGKFAYTDARNQVRNFSRDALDRRLKRRLRASGRIPPHTAV